MIKWIKKRENQIFFSVAILALVVAVCPLLGKYCLLGHDSEYHMLRIEALKQQIEMGRPFLRVNPTYFGGAGYASTMFYPDGLLFIPALLRIIGFSINASYHLFMIICVVLCYAVSYACGKHITKNRYIGMLFAVILTLSSYHLDDVLVRAAAGEYVAFIFIPIVVYGLYNLFFEDMDRPWILGLGMGLVLITHTLSFVLCILMAVIMLLFNFDVFLKKPKLIIKLIITAAVTLIVTAFYWVPVLEQFINDTFYVSKPWIEPAQEAVKFSSIFSFAFPTLGIGLLILVMPRFLLFRNDEDKIMKFSDQCMASAVVFAFLATDIVPWDRIGKYFSIVQFPWRLYIISTVLFAFSAAVIVYRLAGALCIGVTDKPDEYDDEIQVVTDDTLVNKYGVMLGLVLCVMTVSALYGMSLQNREYFDFSDDYYDYKPYTGSVIAGEWLPNRVTEAGDLTDMSEHAVDDNDDEVLFIRHKGNVIITTNGSEEYVDVPLIYYKGYSAKGESGSGYAIDGNGKNGFVRVYTDGAADKITVSYTGTMAQKSSDFITVISVIGIAYIYYRKNKKDRK